MENDRLTVDATGSKRSKRKMSKLTITLLIILGVVVIAGLSVLVWRFTKKPAAKTTTTQSAALMVVDKISGKPISGAKVGTTTSSADGQVSPSSLPSSGSVTVSANGYNNATVQVSSDLKKIELTPTGTVVFVSNRSGKRAIYKSNLDGSGQVELVKPIDDKEDYSPAISPREKYVAFMSTRDDTNNPKLYMVKIDGTGLEKLSDDVSIHSVNWSPDGTYVAWVGKQDKDAKGSRINIKNVVTGETREIGEKEDQIYGYDFSQDDKKIAYGVSNYVDSSRTGTFIANPDGTDASKISDKASHPSYNKNGNVEFIVQDNGSKYMTWYKNSGEVKEIQQDQMQREGWYSPDETTVAYVDNRDGKSNLFLSKPDRSDEKQLTTVGFVSYPVRWTLNGKYITFGVNKPGESARYVIALDGDKGAVKIVDEYSDSGYGEGMY